MDRETKLLSLLEWGQFPISGCTLNEGLVRSWLLSNLWAQRRLERCPMNQGDFCDTW